MAKKSHKSKTTSLLSIKKIKRENIINNAPMVKCIDDIGNLIDYIHKNKASISETLFCEIILKKVSGFEIRNELMKKVSICRPKTKKVMSERANHETKSQENIEKKNKNIKQKTQYRIYDEYRDVKKKLLDKNKIDKTEKNIYENYDYGLSDW